MNTYIRRLLRQHISFGQLTGFFLSNLFGMVIILLSIQFYRDVKPLFTQSDSFLKQEYLIVSKRVSTLGNLAGKSTTFTKKEIDDLNQQDFTQRIAPFTSSQFSVSAGMSMEGTGMQMSTAMFFEAVPDAYVDVQTDQWVFDQTSEVIPIIIPRNYLNLYNFGFAQSRNLPKLSEGVMNLIRMQITLRGNGQVRQFKGQIVGFSSRLNTILVPQAFMDWANKSFAPEVDATPSRLIVEVKNAADGEIAQYFKQKGYETEDNKLDAGKTAYFLRLLIGIVLTVGVVISALSFYILMLSIFLLLQKNTTKLENLLLIGYSPGQVSLPYQLLTGILNLFILLLAIGVVSIARNYYLSEIATIAPQQQSESMLLTIIAGGIIMAVVTSINMLTIKKKIQSLTQIGH